MKSILIGDFLHRIRRPIQLDPEKKYKLVTVKLKHKGVVLREEKLGSEIKSKMYEVKAGDFILSGIDARNGAFGIVPPELDGAIVTNDFWYFKIDEAVVNKHFFLELTATRWFDEICRIGSDGTTQRIRLQKNKFFNQSISIPPLETQETFIKGFKKTATLNGALVSELTHQQILLKKLRQQILQEAIEGKLTADWRQQHPDVEPASELLKRIQDEKAQLIEDKKIRKQKPLPPITPEEIPFEIPDGWEWCRLGNYALFERGKFSMRPRNDQSCYGGIYPFIQIGSLDSKGSVITTCNKTLNEKGLSVSKMFEKGTVMVAIVGGTIGNLGVLGKDMCFPDSMVGVRPYDFCNQDYILLLLRHFQPFLKEVSYQMAGQPNIKLPNLNNLMCALPPLAEQKAIVAKVEKLLTLCDELETQITNNQTHADQLMQSVLKEAFATK